jgi:hypothetical protein
MIVVVENEDKVDGQTLEVTYRNFFNQWNSALSVSFLALGVKCEDTAC